MGLRSPAATRILRVTLQVSFRLAPSDAAGLSGLQPFCSLAKRMTFLNVLLILAMLATVAVLFTGIIGFLRGGAFNARYGNKLMRARVGLQAAALVILAVLFLAS